MELNELKDTWSSLDKRLKKQEVIQENILKEMLLTKTNKSLNRLSNYEWFGLAVVMVALPLPLLLAKDNFSTIQTVLVFVFSAALLYSLIAQIWKIYVLTKIDFSKHLSENIKRINHFNIYIKRERMINYTALPLLLAFFLETYRQAKSINTDRLTAFIIFVCISIGFSIWQYMKFYKKNINSILKSLDNLKELDEE